MVHSHVSTRDTELRSLSLVESRQCQHPEEPLVFCGLCFIVWSQTSNLQCVVDVNSTAITVYLLSDRISTLAETREAYLHSLSRDILIIFPFHDKEGVFTLKTHQ